jgi:hypothetical protein
MMIAVITIRMVEREGRQPGSERAGRRDAVGPLLRWRLSKFIMRALPNWRLVRSRCLKQYESSLIGIFQ